MILPSIFNLIKSHIHAIKTYIKYHIKMTNLYSRQGGYHNESSDEEEEPNAWGYSAGVMQDNYDADDVEEHGFEPRQEQEDDIFIFKNTELPGIPKTEKIKKLVVAEETKVLVTESNRLYRWRVKMDSEFKAYELPEIKG